MNLGARDGLEVGTRLAIRDSAGRVLRRVKVVEVAPDSAVARVFSPFASDELTERLWPATGAAVGGFIGTLLAPGIGTVVGALLGSAATTQDTMNLRGVKQGMRVTMIDPGADLPATSGLPVESGVEVPSTVAAGRIAGGLLLSDYPRDRSVAEDAIAFVEILKGEGYTFIEDSSNSFAFTEPDIERLAMLEHQRWMTARAGDGWTQGAARDDGRKTDPRLVPWERLPEPERSRMRDAIAGLGEVLARVGLAVRAAESGSR